MDRTSFRLRQNGIVSTAQRRRLGEFHVLVGRLAVLDRVRHDTDGTRRRFLDIV